MRTFRYVSTALTALAMAALPACTTGDEAEVSAGDPGWGAFRFENTSGPDFWIAYTRERGWEGMLVEAPYFSRLGTGGAGRVESSQMTMPDLDDLGDLVDSGGGGGGGGGPAFSAEFEGGSSFSASSAEASGFSGSAGGADSFSGSAGGASGFTATLSTVSIGGASCDLTIFCDIAAAFCGELSGAEADACLASVDECIATVNSVVIPTELQGLVCAVAEAFSCLFGVAASGDFESVDEAAAMACLAPLEQYAAQLDF